MFPAAASSAPHPECLGHTETLGTQHWGPRSVCPVLSALSLLVFIRLLTARVLVVLSSGLEKGMSDRLPRSRSLLVSFSIFLDPELRRE